MANTDGEPLDSHDWPDVALPTLDRRTPREAASRTSNDSNPEGALAL